MTDQQDLRALADRIDGIAHSLNTSMLDESIAQLREAASQLGRVGEPVRYVRWHPKHGYAWGHTDQDPFPDEINFGEWQNVALYTSPQLPAGVPDGWVLVPKVATKEMLDAGVDAAVNKAKGNPWCPYAWSAMLANAPKHETSVASVDIGDLMFSQGSAMAVFDESDTTPQPDSAAPGGDVLLLQLADTWDALAEKFYARGGDISRAEAAVMRNDAKELRALLKFILANSNDLRADFTKILPGDVLDDSTYQNIEDALDRLESPMQENGRWLKLHERIAALSAPKQVGAVVGGFDKDEALHLLGEAAGFSAMSPRGRENIEAVMSMLDCFTSSPQAAPKQVGVVDIPESLRARANRYGVGGFNLSVSEYKWLCALASTPPQATPTPKATCIWPDCGHDTNQVNYDGSCNGKFCPQAAPVPVEGEGLAMSPPDGDSFAGWAAWLRDRIATLLDPYVQRPHAEKLASWLESLEDTPPTSQPSADWSDALEKATDRIVASRAEREDVDLGQVTKLLTAYRLVYWRDEEGDQLPLVDLLTPPDSGSIRAGIDEIEQLADYLVSSLIDGAKAGRLPIANGWSGWAVQYPGKLPKLYGDRTIAELNHYPEEGVRLLFLAEQPAKGE